MRVSPQVKCELWLRDLSAGSMVTASAPLWCIGSAEGWGHWEGSRDLWKGYNLTGNLQLLLEASSAFIIGCMSGITFFPIGKKRWKALVLILWSTAVLPPPPITTIRYCHLSDLGLNVSQSSRQLWYWLRTEICKTEQGPLIASSWNSEVWNFLLSLHKIKSYC